MAEPMTNSDLLLTSCYSNYGKLQILLGKGNEILRSMFIHQWDLSHSKWSDSDLNREDFINGPGKQLYSKLKDKQKKTLKNKSITGWDLLLLIDCVKSLNADVPFNVLEDLKSIRNILHHTGISEINDEKYDKFWNQLSRLLLELGLSQKEIDEIKSTPIETKSQPLPTTMLDPEVTELNDFGDEEFRNGNFKEAIEFYTKAICTPGIPKQELAKLYSKRSAAYLKGDDIPSAIEDGKGATQLCPSWWEGYYRLGMGYRAKKKYEKALKNFSLAKNYKSDPNIEIDNEIKLCHRLIHQVKTLEHLDPQHSCTTYEEQAKQIPGVTPEMLKKYDDLEIERGTPAGMCIQGHNYYNGRGVQKDYDQAVKWYSKAAAKGNAEAMHQLALMKINGEGVKIDFKEAMQLLDRAASQPHLNNKKEVNVGVSDAKFTLGLMYQEGSIIPQDYEKAIYWYTEGVKNWCPRCANNLSIMYSRGDGVPQSTELAIEYLKLGAAMGAVRCMENLVIEYLELQDFKKMQQWYLYASEHESVTVKLGSYQVLKNFFEDSVTKNFDKEEFNTALWIELKNGPLKHLINSDMKNHFERIKIGIGKLQNSQPIFDINASNTETYRKEITLAHRIMFKQESSLRKDKLTWHGQRGNLQPKPVEDLFSLKPIYLQEMGKDNKDHIYQGFVLKLTVMEDLHDKSAMGASITTIVHDEKMTFQRLAVYNYKEDKKDVQEVFGFGSKISIVNPYFRIARDKCPVIRVDDFNSMYIHHNERNVKICRYCGNEKYERQPFPCRSCKRCFYCSKKCLKLDALELQHVLVCKKRI